MVKTFQVGQHVVGALRNIENFQGIITAIVQDGNKQKYQVRFENGLIGEYTNRGINAAGENRGAVHNIQPGQTKNVTKSIKMTLQMKIMMKKVMRR